MRASSILFFSLSFACSSACSSSSDDAPATDSGSAPDTVEDTAVADVPGVDTAVPGTPCEASLTAWCAGKECPKDIDLVPTAALCKAAKSGVARSTTACANLQIIQFTDDAGVVQNVYYNSSTGVLAGWTKNTGDAEACVAGNKGFRFPSYTDCAWVFGPDLCLGFDAGVDASSDATDAGDADDAG